MPETSKQKTKMTTSKDLPAIIDSAQIGQMVQNGKLKEVLNQAPVTGWIKAHPLVKGLKYLPIDKIEHLLDTIFQEWRVEVKSISQLAQSICCVIRLHYKNPATGAWEFHDGVGAVPLKTNKGATAADLSAIKSDAVTTGAPAAKSFAIKDAAEHLGKLFGRDLNRRDTIAFKTIYSEKKVEQAEEIEELEKSKRAEEEKIIAAVKAAIVSAKNIEELLKVWQGLDRSMQLNNEVRDAKDKRKGELNEGSKTTAK